MPDPFEDARRSLDEVPAPDLWDEAERRAADGAVVPLSIGARRRRGPSRWLAVAAAAVVAIGTVAVLVDDDDEQSVETAPRGPTAQMRTVVGSEGGCSFAVSSDSISLMTGPADPPILDPSGQAAGQTIAHATLGSQVAEVHMPGFVVIDLVGERVEDVELQRGTAQIWFGGEFVQVRSFPGGDEVCGSFTVTVSGGTEDGNRHAAVDLAERIVLPSEIEGPSLRQTEWQLERSTVDGVPTEGDGSTFTFRQNDVLWSDGCNDFRATFDQRWSATLDLLGGIESSDVGCSPNPTSDAIAAVMSSDESASGAPALETGSTIHVSYEGELLILQSGNTVLTLRPIDRGDPGTTTSIVGSDTPLADGLVGTTWRVVELASGDEDVPLDAVTDPALLEFTFNAGEMGWNDGCNGLGGDLVIDEDGYLEVDNAIGTHMLCRGVTTGPQPWDVIGAVMGSDRIAVRQPGDRLELSGGDKDRITLERI